MNIERNAKFTAKITLPKDEFNLHVLAMKPDLESKMGRSSISLTDDGHNFYIYIESPDTVALKSTLNSIARWFKVVDDIKGRIN
ncbi:MAG: KEOPS complex subunit Pcc1 [Thermoplasmataceae archaeon]